LKDRNIEALKNISFSTKLVRYWGSWERAGEARAPS